MASRILALSLSTIPCSRPQPATLLVVSSLFTDRRAVDPNPQVGISLDVLFAASASRWPFPPWQPEWPCRTATLKVSYRLSEEESNAEPRGRLETSLRIHCVREPAQTHARGRSMRARLRA